jgi:dTDP-4-dehydrorhamnose reductase
MRMLLLGKDGQVGRALEQRLRPLGELVVCGRITANLEEPDALAGLVERVQPDFIINAAAYTAVDKAESDAARARLVNAEAVAALAASARKDRWLVHFSTDFVFDGLKPEPHVETDDAKPLSVYGATKLAGDQAILNAGCNHLIFRVSWVYSLGHDNFPSTILRLGKDRTDLRVVADQIGAPTSAGLIAEITAKAIARIVNIDGDAKGLSGLYHLAPSGAVSRADLAKYVISESRRQGAGLMIWPEGVTPIPTADYKTLAVRPLNSRLETKKLQHAFGVGLPPWQDDMRSFITDMVRGETA